MRTPSAPAQECTTKIAWPTPSFASASSIIRPWISGVESARRARVLQPCPGRSIRITRWFFASRCANGLPHHFEIGAGAMQHHDRRTGRIARADIDDMKRRAGNLDHPARGGMGPLRSANTPACVTSASIASAATTITATIENVRMMFWHQRDTVLAGAGFRRVFHKPPNPVDSGVIWASSEILYSDADTFAMCRTCLIGMWPTPALVPNIHRNAGGEPDILFHEYNRRTINDFRRKRSGHRPDRGDL